MQKNLLREKYKKIRNEISEKNEKSEVIFSNLIELKIFDNYNIIAVYKNLPNEVDTKKIIQYLLQKNKTVVLPKVVENNKMDFYKIDNEECLVPNKFGILEPKADMKNLIKISEVELFIIPGICFDKNNNRVGFGKGYYDRCLENSTAKKVGICFKEQICIEDIEVDEYDISMDLVITD